MIFGDGERFWGLGGIYNPDLENLKEMWQKKEETQAGVRLHKVDGYVEQWVAKMSE